MKKHIRIINMFLVCIFTFGLLAIISGCSLLIPEGDGKRVYGDFIYSYIGSADARRTNKNGKYVVIRGLSEEGKKKDTIIVPEKIDGKKVVQIGFETYGVHDTIDGKYSKLYLPSTLISIPFGGFHTGSSKVFFLEKPDERFFENGQGIVYVPVDLYNELKGKDVNHYLCPGNVTYIVDGKNYGFDDVDNFIIAPQEPVKAGYKFAGWYEEPECVNKWDFENDSVPKKNMETIDNLGGNDFSGEPLNIINHFMYYYSETRLYAKWIKE